MSRTNNVRASEPVKRGRPAISPDGRENQLINLAMDLAEEQLRNGSASSQVISHFLKLGSSIAKMQEEKYRYETELVKAKTKSLESSERSEKLYEEVITAMKRYSGYTEAEVIDEEDIY